MVQISPLAPPVWYETPERCVCARVGALCACCWHLTVEARDAAEGPTVHRTVPNNELAGPEGHQCHSGKPHLDVLESSAMY